MGLCSFAALAAIISSAAIIATVAIVPATASLAPIIAFGAACRMLESAIASSMGWCDVLPI